jgi:hypothetical protein
MLELIFLTSFAFITVKVILKSFERVILYPEDHPGVLSNEVAAYQFQRFESNTMAVGSKAVSSNVKGSANTEPSEV